MPASSGATDTGTETMNNWNTKRRQLAKQFPTTKEELKKIAEAYRGPITKVPMMTEEETETDKLWALFKREWHTPSVVEVPVRGKPTITRRV
jgi:hypothetical protein